MAEDPRNASLDDEEVIRLVEVEREAGVPDVQTAAAAAEAKERVSSALQEDQAAAHPS